MYLLIQYFIKYKVTLDILNESLLLIVSNTATKTG